MNMNRISGDTRVQQHLELLKGTYVKGNIFML
jgi:hypothetical protein